MDHYKENEDKIRKIQALWRGRATRKGFHTFMQMYEPPFPIVQHFCRILKFNADYYTEELNLLQMKKETVQFIKKNQDVSDELGKIGRLMENKKTDASGAYRCTQPALSMESRQMLEEYQHLFYELQTNPNYLARLFFLQTERRSLPNVVKTIFNYGSSLREEYFLLKLLKTALRKEIKNKFENPLEVVTNKSLILKMVVDYIKKSSGPPALREIMGPITEQLICYETIRLEINPVEIYKHWRNELETEYGKDIMFPYTVSEYQALQFEEVKIRLISNMKLLQSVMSECLNHITASRNLIPYGIKYIAKVLNDNLSQKFPETPEVSILEVVGNLIYHSFINDALVAPDTYDIEALHTTQCRSNELRKNLAVVAKFLQFATSEKGLSEERWYLQTFLNPSFMIECHEKFTRFFRDCCAIEELEDHFGISEYTETMLIRKPEITISVQDINDILSLLMDYRYLVVPDPLDQMHKMLGYLGFTPIYQTVLELTGSTVAVNIDELYSKTKVTLALSKFEVPEDIDIELDILFIKAKEVLLSIIQSLRGETLREALEIDREDSGSVEVGKRQLQHYLNELEHYGRVWVSPDDDYQCIITGIANDLRNKGDHRVLRNNERKMLRATIEQCLANLNTSSRNFLSSH